MPASYQVLDALWHHLCPSFNIACTTRTPMTRYCTQKWSQPPVTTTRAIRKSFHIPSSFPCFQRLITPYKPDRIRHFQTSATTRLGRSHENEHIAPKHWLPDYAATTSETTENQDRRGSSKSVSQLYEILRWSGRNGDFARVQEIARELMERNERPNARIYDALILANTSTDHGCVEAVELLLREMAEEKILLDSAAYHAVLKVFWPSLQPVCSNRLRIPRFSQYIRATSYVKISSTSYGRDGLP